MTATIDQAPFTLQKALIHLTHQAIRTYGKAKNLEKSGWFSAKTLDAPPNNCKMNASASNFAGRNTIWPRKGQGENDDDRNDC